MTSNAIKLDTVTRDIVALSKYLTPAQNRAIKARTGTAMTSALNAAFAAAIAAGAASAWCADGEYTLDGNGISIASPLIVEGTGPTKCIFRQTNPTGAFGIRFAYATLLQGGGLRGITIEAGDGWQTDGYQGSGCTGVGLALDNCNDLFKADNFQVCNFDYGITVKGCYNTEFGGAGSRVLYFTQRGVQIDGSPNLTSGGNPVVGAGNTFTIGKISNNGFTGTNTGSRGIELLSSGGEFFVGKIDITGCANGVVIQPPAGRQVAYAHFTTVLCDTSLYDAWLIDATDGDIVAVTCNGCWGAFSTDGAGLKTMGANLDGFEWNGGNLRENGFQGWVHSGGSNVWLDGVQIASNGKKTSNTYPGVQVAGGVSNWGVTDCRIGNFASGASPQAEGIKIDSGLSQNFTILGNDLNNAGAGKVAIANGSSLLNWTISGNLPKLAVGNNSSDTVETNGTATSTASATFARTLAGTARVARTIRVSTSAAPSAGKSFIYTLWVDGVAQAFTLTISDANTSGSATGAIIISAGSLYELRLTNSGSPSAADHYWSVVAEA